MELPKLTDTLLSEIIKYIRSHTAMRAWFAEFLTVFVLFTTGRFGLAVWMRMETYPDKPWWNAWLYAYDNLRAYADDALIAGLVFVIIFEGVFMFLARKRIALSRVEGREEGVEEGRKQGIEVGRAEAQAESAVVIRQMQEAQAESAVVIRQMLEGQAESAAQIRAMQERIRELEGRNGNSGG